MKALLLFAAIACSTSTVLAQALPFAVRIDAREAQAIVARHMPQTGWALREAGISRRAKATGGTSTRHGMPGNYSDVIVITMASCGATSTTPCRIEGCLNITESHRGDRQQATINASKQCQ